VSPPNGVRKPETGLSPCPHDELYDAAKLAAIGSIAHIQTRVL